MSTTKNNKWKLQQPSTGNKIVSFTMDVPEYNNGWVFKQFYTRGKTKFKVVERSAPCVPQTPGPEYDPIQIILSKKNLYFEYYMNKVVFKKEGGKNRMIVGACT